MPHIPYTAPFLLIGKDGSTAVFDTLADIWMHRPLVATTGRTPYDGLTVGLYFDSLVVPLLSRLRQFHDNRTVEWIVRDFYGRPVPEAVITAAFRDLPCEAVAAHMPTRKLRRWERRWRMRPEVAFRAGPVPGLRRRRPSRRGHRCFRHIAAKRAAELLVSFAEEENVSIKGRIHYGALPPDPWGDYMPSDWDHRTWKRHRSHQWKPKG